MLLKKYRAFLVASLTLYNYKGIIAYSMVEARYVDIIDAS